MIQRIQSIYLLLAATFSGLTTIAPLWRETASGLSERIQGFQFLLQSNAELTFFIDTQEIQKTVFFFAHADLLRTIVHWVLMGSIALVTLLALVNIFRFGNRKGQKRLNTWLMILTWLQLAAAGLLAFLPAVFLDAKAVPAIEYGAVLPLLTLLFLWLANRGIRRDEDLIRSVDRIR